MILIAYDGSPDAKTAIGHAGRLLPGADATVLTIWEPFATMLGRTPETLRPLAAVHKADVIDREEADAAEQSSQEGSELARAAGLNATPLATALNGSVADTIIQQADRLDVDGSWSAHADSVGWRCCSAACRSPSYSAQTAPWWSSPRPTSQANATTAKISDGCPVRLAL